MGAFTPFEHISSPPLSRSDLHDIKVYIGTVEQQRENGDYEIHEYREWYEELLIHCKELSALCEWFISKTEIMERNSRTAENEVNPIKRVTEHNANTGDS